MQLILIMEYSYTLRTAREKPPPFLFPQYARTFVLLTQAKMAQDLDTLLNQLEKELQSNQDELVNWSLNYFRMHRYRYRHDLSVVREYYSEGEVLEAGSLPCHMTWLLEKSGFPTVGLDIEPERAAGFIRDHGLRVTQCNFETETIPYEDGRFHFILLNEVFEHLRINPIATLREINRVMHPDGHIMLTTPNLYSLYNIQSLLRGRGFDNPYQQFEKLETLGHMGHVREYTNRQVKEFLSNTGFEPVHTHYVDHSKYGGNLKVLNALSFIRPFRRFQEVISKKEKS